VGLWTTPSRSAAPTRRGRRCPRVVDEAGHVASHAGAGDDRPQRPLPERFLNVDDEKNTSHDDKHPAGTELQATGEEARKRSDDTRTDLTPQEEEIGQLAREGQTNSEIGAQLFIGGRTVEWHLRNVFAQAGHRLPPRA
jgi:ATP/maltotriose-dependent transcriptional regulator MalT